MLAGISPGDDGRNVGALDPQIDINKPVFAVQTLGRWRTGSGGQVLALNHGFPDPLQLGGPIATKAVLDGVNHGFQCNAPAVPKEPLAQKKHSSHIDARTCQSV